MPQRPVTATQLRGMADGFRDVVLRIANGKVQEHWDSAKRMAAPPGAPKPAAFEQPASQMARGSMGTLSAEELRNLELATLEGRVRLVPGGGPAAYANVFLLGTRFGAVTDDSGKYVMKRLPGGASYVGRLSSGPRESSTDDRAPTRPELRADPRAPEPEQGPRVFDPTRNHCLAHGACRDARHDPRTRGVRPR